MTADQVIAILSVGTSRGLEQISLSRIARLLGEAPDDVRRAVTDAISCGAVIGHGAKDKRFYEINRKRTTKPHNSQTKAHIQAHYDWARALRAEGYQVTLPEERLRNCLSCAKTFKSTHIGNRRCSSCNSKTYAIADYGVSV